MWASVLLSADGCWVGLPQANEQRIFCRRPYRVECTGSLLTSEVKQRRARSVLGWGTAWEDLRVLSAFRLAFDPKGVFCEIDELIAGPSKHRYRCCPESNHSRMRNSRLQKLSKFKASGHGKNRFTQKQLICFNRNEKMQKIRVKNGESHRNKILGHP